MMVNMFAQLSRWLQYSAAVEYDNKQWNKVALIIYVNVEDNGSKFNNDPSLISITKPLVTEVKQERKQLSQYCTSLL